MATSRMTVAQRKIDILEGRIANFIAARTASLSEDEARKAARRSRIPWVMVKRARRELHERADMSSRLAGR